MEKPPPNERTKVDALAREGHLRGEGDIPGFDLFDQEGDPTNVTEGGGSVDEAFGDTNRTRRADEIRGAVLEGVPGLSIVDPHELEGNPDPVDDAERWLVENDPNHPRYSGKK